MKTRYTAICAVALLALATTGCAKMMADSGDGSTSEAGTGMSGAAGSGGSGGSGGGFGGSGSGTMRAGRSGGGMAERVPVKEFQPAHELHDVHFDFERGEVRHGHHGSTREAAAHRRGDHLSNLGLLAQHRAAEWRANQRALEIRMSVP